MSAPTRALSLAELVRAEQSGLDLNRCLFVVWLIQTGRISDDLPRRPWRAEWPLAALAVGGLAAALVLGWGG